MRDASRCINSSEKVLIYFDIHAVRWKQLAKHELTIPNATMYLQSDSNKSHSSAVWCLIGDESETNADI